jgi:hypothetical protein
MIGKLIFNNYGLRLTIAVMVDVSMFGWGCWGCIHPIDLPTMDVKNINKPGSITPIISYNGIF